MAATPSTGSPSWHSWHSSVWLLAPGMNPRGCSSALASTSRTRRSGAEGPMAVGRRAHVPGDRVDGAVAQAAALTGSGLHGEGRVRGECHQLVAVHPQARDRRLGVIRLVEVLDQGQLRGLQDEPHTIGIHAERQPADTPHRDGGLSLGMDTDGVRFVLEATELPLVEDLDQPDDAEPAVARLWMDRDQL